MENLERLQAAYKDNSKQMSEIITRYHKRMQDKEIAFNAIFAKIWELDLQRYGNLNQGQREHRTPLPQLKILQNKQ